MPDALREWLIIFRARYRAALPPIMITESGCAYNDGPDENGVVDDQRRIDYLDAHVRAVATAIERGVDIRGYYTWSLMDNFEWAEGYTPAVRPGPHRLRDAAADAEEVVPVVRRPDRGPAAGREQPVDSAVQLSAEAIRRTISVSRSGEVAMFSRTWPSSPGW